MSKGKRLNLTLPDALMAQLDQEAAAHRTKVPELVRRLVAEGLVQFNGRALETRLREAYAELAAEDRSLSKEFRHVDAEGWA